VRIPAIGFDASAAVRVHRGEIRIGDNNPLPELFQAARNPFAFG
jgi:hypothetical protein